MSRWTMRLLALAALVAWSGCSAPQVRATNGRLQTDMLAAVRASAVRDLPCDTSAIVVKDVSTQQMNEFVATGCGLGVLYRNAWVEGSGTPEVVEIGRFALSPAPAR